MQIRYLKTSGDYAAGDVRECDDRTAMAVILSGAAEYEAGNTPADRAAEDAAAAAQAHADATGE